MQSDVFENFYVVLEKIISVFLDFFRLFAYFIKWL